METRLKTLSFSHFQEAFTDETDNLYPQFITISSIEGAAGVFYNIKTEGEHGWSFSEIDDILKLIKEHQRVTRGIVE